MGKQKKLDCFGRKKEESYFRRKNVDGDVAAVDKGSVYNSSKEQASLLAIEATLTRQDGEHGGIFILIELGSQRTKNIISGSSPSTIDRKV